jgi:hypothetical protein
MDVADGSILILNLLATANAVNSEPTIPDEFMGGQVIWRTSLRNRYPVILVARVQPPDHSTSARLEYLRTTLGPRIKYTEPVLAPYSELVDTHWGPGGNIVLVVPMWPETHQIPAS